MVTSILSLPNEILFQILGDECLSNGDLGRAECTCRLFQANIQEYIAPRRRYTFWVDAVDQPAWRLVRHLLANPKLGEQFVEINVKWKRRIAGDKETWTKDWKWKRKEVSRIRKLTTRWKMNTRTAYNILRGKNSEALLPLLLCFTPNLKSLDLGNINRDIMDCGRSEHVQALEALGVDINYEIGSAPGIYSSESQMFMPDNHQLFFFDNLEYQNEGGFNEGPRKLPPGLSNLENFSLGAWGKDEKPFNAQDLFPVFCFPKIKSIHASGLIDNSNDIYSIARYTPNSRKISPVKHLTLESYGRERSTSIRLGSIKRIARITRNLETLIIRNKSSRIYDSTKKSDEKLARRFLKYSKDTLDPTRLRINGGSFTNAGEYDEDTEKREGVARRQRLFEQTQTRLRNPNFKPSPMVTLKPEIISRILSFLQRKDVFNLMLSSKALYKPCYHNIWSGFAFLASYYQLDTHFAYKYSLTDDEADHLLNIINSFETNGIRCLEQLEVESGFLSDWSHSYEREDVLRHISEEIERGYAPKFRALHLKFRSYVSRDRNLAPFDDSTRPGPDFFAAVKKYSERKSPHEFSLRIEMNAQSAELFDLCDIGKLTNLQLDSRFGKFLEAENELEEFINLLAIASISGQLKVLTLGGNHYKRKAKRLDSLWDSLDALQKVVSSLKSVTSLTVKHGYLFHPSFLLLPPENVKVLSYMGRMSPCWWRKFAKHPFTGIERLHLSCDSLDSHETKSLGIADEETYASFTDFRLGELEVSGLKWLSVSESQSSAYPADFFERILKNNPQLPPYCLQAIVKNKRDLFTENMKAKIPQIVSSCGNELNRQLTKALEGCTQDFATTFQRRQQPLQLDFEKVMANSSLELLTKQFENEHALSFVKNCAEALRKQIGQDEGKEDADKKPSGDPSLDESSDSDFFDADEDSSDDSDDDDEFEEDYETRWARGEVSYEENVMIDRLWGTALPVSDESTDSADKSDEEEDDDDDDDDEEPNDNTNYTGSDGDP
ncbi:hypothetical protein TWF132_000203 [Orbilia oligospora]|nr:hypothetical protein TWF132_000203 [Orbilia oligospora]